MPKYKFGFSYMAYGERTIQASSLEEARRKFYDNEPRSTKRYFFPYWKELPWDNNAIEIDWVNDACEPRFEGGIDDGTGLTEKEWLTENPWKKDGGQV